MENLEALVVLLHHGSSRASLLHSMTGILFSTTEKLHHALIHTPATQMILRSLSNTTQVDGTATNGKADIRI
jgi:hypothetical protein